MAKKKRTHVPGTSDATVKARTGRTWAAWFALLDRAGARAWAHRRIARLLAERHGVSGWWAQMVALQFELARGLRARHQTAGGYSVTVSKTVATSLSDLYGAIARPARRRAWFPPGTLEPSSRTRNKYFRGAWNRVQRLEVGFYPKGRQKAQIALAVSRLPRAADVEAHRRTWRRALDRLAALVEM